ncbi:protein DEHYDRATION-INDUCED 19-like [Rosa rugosa]|uniref:protein DEHYDRATION-INDUCED 19-like n=1 Tax=Rosa rugosa TaxID=74645 RepID=UPI002B4127DB|nr:protein DEHYDRATION-INDUCED 19-like [Rosa rugosa]
MPYMVTLCYQVLEILLGSTDYSTWRTFGPSAASSLRWSSGMYCLLEVLRFSQVCPICSIKVTRDMLSHITLQHGHLFKLQRRRRLRRVAVPNSQALSLLGQDLREAHLQVLLGSGGYRSENANVTNAATDPFLSSLILNFPASGADEISKSVVTTAEDTPAKKVAPSHIWKSRQHIDLGSIDWSRHCQTFVWIGEEFKHLQGTSANPQGGA